MGPIETLIEKARAAHARRMISIREMERRALDKILRDCGLPMVDDPTGLRAAEDAMGSTMADNDCDGMG